MHTTDLQRALDDIDAATRGMDAGELDQRTGARWSPAQILEHLALGFGATAKGAARCLESGRPAASVPTLRHRVATAVVVRFGYLPSGRTAPERTRPRGLSGDAAMQAVRANLIAMDEGLARCAERFGARVPILAHPILGPLSVAQWRTFHRVHTRHHMKQIVRLREGALRIRREQSGDEAAIAHVNDAAFGGPAEARLVDAVRRAGHAAISLVAVTGSRIAGHILFTPIVLDPPAAPLLMLGLGPMAVLPECQRHGIGSRLVEAGLRECAQAGCGVVVVIGHPEFYPRFGFRPAGAYGLRNEYGVDDEAFMVLELVPGALSDRRGLVRYVPEFGA